MSSQALAVAAPPRLTRFLAYAAIYFLWGASFLAIRVLVGAVPPLLAAGVRFLSAGLILFAWSVLRGVALPTLRQWRSAVLLGVVMFACDYGPLFWAEQRIPSGIAAIISALIPVWIAAFEWTRSPAHMPARLLLGTCSGVAGVVVLSLRPAKLTGGGMELLPFAAILFGTFAWAAGTLWSRRLPLPAAKPMAASIQMILGGFTLALASLVSGDLVHFVPSRVDARAMISMFYLVIGASIIAFTAYVWLLGHEPATRVASYAYVNPVVAVVLGSLLGGEKLTLQVIVGMLLVLTGVLAVLGGGGAPTPSPDLPSGSSDAVSTVTKVF